MKVVLVKWWWYSKGGFDGMVGVAKRVLCGFDGYVVVPKGVKSGFGEMVVDDF